MSLRCRIGIHKRDENGSCVRCGKHKHCYHRCGHRNEKIKSHHGVVEKKVYYNIEKCCHCKKKVKYGPYECVENDSQEM